MPGEKKSHKIPKIRLVRILMMYYACPCKYRNKGESLWKFGTVTAEMASNIDNIDVILLLHPLYRLQKEHIEVIHKLTVSEDELNLDDAPDYSESGIKEFREHLQDNIEMAPYNVIDYLRREDFAVPVYGLDLFRARIAEVYRKPQSK